MQNRPHLPFALLLFCVSLLLVLFSSCKNKGNPYDNPTADFTFLVKNCVAPFSVQFTNKSYHKQNSYWEFGDGSFSWERSPIHTYDSAAIYTVKLVEANENGEVERDSIYKEIDLLKTPKPPSPSFSFRINNCQPPYSVTLLNGTAPGASSYSWSIPGVDTISGRQPTVIFPLQGVYSVKLTVYRCGAKRSATRSLQLDPTKTLPNALFTFSGNNEVESGWHLTGSTIEFENKSNNVSSYSWNFGDGGYATTRDASHTFSAGNWNVKLTVDCDGVTDTYSQEVRVRDPKEIVITGITLTSWQFKTWDDTSEVNGMEPDIYLKAAGSGSTITTSVKEDVTSSSVSWTTNWKISSPFSSNYIDAYDEDLDADDHMGGISFKMGDLWDPGKYSGTGSFSIGHVAVSVTCIYK